MAKEIAKALEPERRGALVYVGPNLIKPAFVARSTVFKGGELPALLAEAAKDDPNLAALFVPVEELGRAMLAIGTPGSNLAKASAAVARKGGA